MGELFLPLGGLVGCDRRDRAAQKGLERIKAEIFKSRNKTSQSSFTQKSAEILEEHQKRLEDWKAKREHVLMRCRHCRANKFWGTQNNFPNIRLMRRYKPQLVFFFSDSSSFPDANHRQRGRPQYAMSKCSRTVA